MNLLGKAPSWIEVEGFTIGEVPWLKDFLRKDLLDYFHSFRVFLCCNQTVSHLSSSFISSFFCDCVCDSIWQCFVVFSMHVNSIVAMCVYGSWALHMLLPLHFTCLEFFSLRFPLIAFIPKRFVVHWWRMLLTSLNERELRSESLMGLAPLLIHWISKFLNSWMQFLQMTRTLFHTHEWILIW
jgi:hypothetical protein